MSDDIKDLKQDYRGIEAPPHLATRIRAEVNDRPLHARTWMPAAVTTAVAAVLILPFLSQQPSTTPTVPSKPSLAAIAALAPERPPTQLPNLSRVRSVSVPRLPNKPRISTQRPQSNLESEFELLKENDHADA